MLKLVFYVIWKQNNKIKAKKPKIAEGNHKNSARRKAKIPKNSNFTFYLWTTRSEFGQVGAKTCFLCYLELEEHFKKIV